MDSAQSIPTSLPFCLIAALSMASTWKRETYDAGSALNAEFREAW